MNLTLNFKPVFFVCGVLLLVLSVAMFVPMVTDLAGANPDWKVFAGAQITTTFIGFLLIFSTREKVLRLGVRETFLATALCWTVVPAFAALPFCFSSLGMTPSQGFFEAMSGITTTGLSAIEGLDGRPHGILLWRALLQWLGGIGGLVSALAILPLLQVSGQQVFRAQSLDISKIMPSSSQMAAWICLIYIALTAFCAFLLSKAGMTGFEALCHALSALSTGGFSTSAASAGHFGNAAQAVLAAFMLVGSIPFTLYLRMTRGDRLAVFRDGQVRAYLVTLALVGFSMMIYLLATTTLGVPEAFHHAAFRVVSLMTTTGFTLDDGALWGPFAVIAFFALALVGGCSGSTGGGIKIFRVQLLLSMLRLQVKKLIEPNGVFQARYNGKPVDAEVQAAIGVFLLAWLFVFAAGGVLLTLAGTGFAPAFTSALAAITNTGPALGTLHAPLADFSTMGGESLWVLSACMLMGRMEIFALLVLFSPRFWRR